MIIIKERKQNGLPYVQKNTLGENYHESSGSETRDQNSVRVVSVTEVLLQKQGSQPEAGIKDCSCNRKRIQEHAGTSGNVWELFHQTVPV